MPIVTHRLLAAVGLIGAVMLSPLTLSAQSLARSQGIAIGTPAPDFVLKDQQGVERPLKELAKDANVALVFYRSADW